MELNKFENLLNRLEITWEKKEIRKNNNIILTGYQIGTKKIKPCIYEDTIKKNDEISLVKMIEEIINGLENTDFVFTKENVQLKVYPAVRSRKLNEEDKETVTMPVENFDDLEMYFYIKLEQKELKALGIVNTEEDGTATVTIHKGLLKEIGLNPEELYAYADINMNRDLRIKSILQALTETIENENEIPFDTEEKSIVEAADEIIYIATNPTKIKGAGVIASKLCMEKIKEFAKKKEWGSFAILPSSIHEVLIVKMEGIDDKETYDNMVKEVNRDVVEKRDILEEHSYIFIYDRFEKDYMTLS